MSDTEPNRWHARMDCKAVAVVLCIAWLVAVSCGGAGRSNTTEAVPLASLVANPERWRGENVEVEGELVEFTDPGGGTYGVIEDPMMNRVGLKSTVGFKGLIGSQVTVSGVLSFDPSFGWYLLDPVVEAAP